MTGGALEQSPQSAVPVPRLERLGVQYLRGLSRKLGRIDAGDGVAYLNPDERKALRGVEHGAIARAAVAGALSTMASAAVEIVAQPMLGTTPDHAPWDVRLRFWAVVGGVTAVASVVEIAFLYWDGLRSVHRLSHAAGLDLLPDEEGPESVAIAHGMARAVLELPNPAAALFGVDPHREASRLGIVMASVVYKLKVSVSNFLIKTLVARVLGRAVVRTWLPFVAVPITALWNALVARLVVREARIRCMGPSAAQEMMRAVLAEHGQALTSDGRRAVLRAVASSIVRTRDLHPNLVALLVVVRGVAGDADTRDLDRPRELVAALSRLASAEQALALEVLAIAAVIDGRITRAERALLVEARRACGRRADVSACQRLLRAFVSGDALDVVLLRSTAA